MGNEYSLATQKVRGGKCSTHQEYYDYYCDSCDGPVCNSCHTSSNPGHSVIPSEHNLRATQQSVAPILEQCTKNEQAWQDQLERLQAKKIAQEHMYIETKKVIQQDFDEAINFLVQRRDALTSACNEAWAEHRNTLERAETVLKHRIGLTQSRIRSCNKLRTKQNPDIRRKKHCELLHSFDEARKPPDSSIESLIAWDADVDLHPQILPAVQTAVSYYTYEYDVPPSSQVARLNKEAGRYDNCLGLMHLVFSDHSYASANKTEIDLSDIISPTTRKNVSAIVFCCHCPSPSLPRVILVYEPVLVLGLVSV